MLGRVGCTGFGFCWVKEFDVHVECNWNVDLPGKGRTRGRQVSVELTLWFVP